VADLKQPDWLPRWLVPLLLPVVRPFAVTEAVLERRPWEMIRAAMQGCLTSVSWTELYFGFAYLSAGERADGS
jgi:demethylmenaquinone methyltransferase/2-methoxy-6-polyprenyl-1,4-benzoquinol methylase